MLRLVAVMPRWATEVRDVAMPAKQEHAAADRQGMVIDAALELAAERGWDQVRFHLLAERTGMPMPEIGVAFRDVDAIANAWFARARLHLLGLPETALGDSVARCADRNGMRALARLPGTASPRRVMSSPIFRSSATPSYRARDSLTNRRR